jgi:hypothetical protein
MTSQINPNNINGAYPVAGQDNNSQGFRDNFTNTGTNFQYAANEITALQGAAILNSQISGGSVLTTQNNMNNNPLINALIKDFAATSVSLGTLTGTVTIDYAAGHYQTVTAGGNISLAFTNWPIAGQYGAVTLQITITNPSTQAVTFPAAVSLNNEIVGWNYSTNTLRFAIAGVYAFSFATSDNGSTIRISNLNNTLQPLNASAQNVNSNVALGLGYTSTYANTAGGAITTTLAAGVDRQIKVLILGIGNASMTVNVANAGWNGGTTGNIVLSSRGQGCTLQMGTTNWFCIGNNGATFS